MLPQWRPSRHVTVLSSIPIWWYCCLPSSHHVLLFHLLFVLVVVACLWTTTRYVSSLSLRNLLEQEPQLLPFSKVSSQEQWWKSSQYVMVAHESRWFLLRGQRTFIRP